MEDTAAQDVATDTTSAPGFPDPSPQEAMFFFNMIKNMNNQPDIDWDGVATDSGFKNAAVAKKRFYQIKQKLGLDSRTNTAVVKTPRTPRTPRTPNTPRKPRKTKGTTAVAVSAASDAADADNEDTEAAPLTPPKSAKRRKTNTGKAVSMELSEANVKKLRDVKLEANSEATPEATPKASPEPATDKKQGRSPLPFHRAQQRTPSASESGSEDKNLANAEDKGVAGHCVDDVMLDSITVTPPRVKCHGDELIKDESEI
ncbi:uncharacterized protein SPSK_01909 [Sporothrix schenckii 1099-18]|uniref:Myb-like DNA-binding domain-containing protein n=1 Tax=Sporothrix schenckii 1099-18 TaxID=1397361 RepID=A0A0F2ME31_SPOSC|nr:uncharacterized protein SPSK_01909 [Sporothrix schenckii 1099-18]KJR87354.1 hypothetical protein SPSK_01909 [Sporothrix schenckii 1099-18]